MGNSDNFDGFRVSGNASAEPLNRLRPSVRSELVRLFGEEGFTDDESVRKELSKTTLPVSTYPLGVVRPTKVDQVQSLMRILVPNQIPWHAYSLGKNWGYGDRCAAADGHLLIDLQRMNRIVEINEELAYAVIEPGVSQGQLAEELIKRNSRLMLDVTGAGPDASIVGNILQRGFGHTPYGDRFAHSCNYEVVLPDGKMTRTGFGDIENSIVGHVYPYGCGPNIQGMLPQSRDAIVTRMTIWLMPRPEAIEGFGFKTDDDEAFKRIVDTIGRLRQDGVVDSVVHLANDLRVLSSQPSLRTLSGRHTPLTEKERAELRKRAGVGRWNGLGGIYGTRSIVKAKRRHIRKALRKHCRVRFFTQGHVRFLEAATARIPTRGPLSRFRNLADAIKDVNELLCGVPTASHLEGAFFRNRPDSGEVIDAGLIWIAPVIPCSGDSAIQLIDGLEPIMNEFGFDLPITISPVAERAAVCIANISFDKRSEEENGIALHAYEAITKKTKSMGFPLYRTSKVSIGRPQVNSIEI